MPEMQKEWGKALHGTDAEASPAGVPPAGVALGGKEGPAAGEVSRPPAGRQVHSLRQMPLPPVSLCSYTVLSARGAGTSDGMPCHPGSLVAMQ